MGATNTPTKSRRTGQVGSDVNDLAVQYNTLRQSAQYMVEDLAAGAAITARAVWCAPASGAAYVHEAYVLHEAASVGVDGSNTSVLTLRNITQGVDIATVTLSATNSANDKSTLTVSNGALAAGDVVGVVVTNGATANPGKLNFVWWYRTSEQIGNAAGTALT